ncbi:DUF2946 domain-containing protein [Marinobacter sp. KM021]|uniref:DUF2946 domain-containing protein n=1 Tax=Marinobacter sp. KM021 TaxID=3075616 RepID=UPI003D6C3E01
MTAQRHNRWPAWIALLSMVLIYLGPLLTQAQSGQHEAPNAHSGHHGHHNSSPPSEETDHSDPLQHLAHGECGYCVLLSKLPALSQQSTSVSTGSIASPHAVLGRLNLFPRGIPRFPNAPVRAPPIMV